MSQHRISWTENININGSYTVIQSVDSLNKIIKNTTLEKSLPISIYTKSYFEKHALIFIPIIESSGSITHMLKDIAVAENSLNINIKRNVPCVGTCDMAKWILIVDIDSEIVLQIKPVKINIE